jgi:glycine hydroxymethyltransferase
VAFKEALSPEFKIYAQQVVANAQALSTSLINNGVNIVSGGTDNHLMMVDLRSLNLTGKEGDALLTAINITANKNTVPNDPQPPLIGSGIRLGTPAITTRGMGTAEMKQIGEMIAACLKQSQSPEVLKQQVLALSQAFPLYPELSPLVAACAV